MKLFAALIAGLFANAVWAEGHTLGPSPSDKKRDAAATRAESKVEEINEGSKARRAVTKKAREMDNEQNPGSGSKSEQEKRKERQKN